MLTDGNNRPLSFDEVASIDIYEYMDVKSILEYLDCGLQRAHIHRFIARGEIKPERILILHDSWNPDKTIKVHVSTKGWAKGTKTFIHKDDVEMIREHYEETYYKTKPRCRYCERVWFHCKKHPCLGSKLLDPVFKAQWESDERERQEQEQLKAREQRIVDTTYESLWNAARQSRGNKGLATINANRRQAAIRQHTVARDSATGGIPFDEQ